MCSEAPPASLAEDLESTWVPPSELGTLPYLRQPGVFIILGQEVRPKTLKNDVYGIVECIICSVGVDMPKVFCCCCKYHFVNYCNLIEIDANGGCFSSIDTRRRTTHPVWSGLGEGGAL